MSVPTRIVWGREDRLLPTEFAYHLHDRIPHVELTRVDGEGHTIQKDAPARLLAQLNADFQSLPA